MKPFQLGGFNVGPLVAGVSTQNHQPQRAPELREMVDKRKANTLTTEDTRRLLDASIARESEREERKRRAGIYRRLATACEFAAASPTMRSWEWFESEIQKLIGELNGQ